MAWDRKSYMIILLIIFLSSSASGYILREDMRLSVSAAGVSGFSLRNVTGSVKVGVWDKDSVSVEAMFKIRAVSKRSAEEMYRQSSIDFLREGGAVHLEAELPPVRQYGIPGFDGNGRSSISIRYSVMVPRNMNSVIEVSNGNITLENIEGSYKLLIGTGDADVETFGAGKGEITVGRGDIECRIYRPEWSGILKAESGEGDISVYFHPEADLAIEGTALRGEARFLFRAAEPLVRKRESFYAVFGNGKGRMRLASVRGKVIAADINKGLN